MITKLCSIVVITAISALILKSYKPDFVPLCLTAGGIILLLYSFDYLSQSINFIKTFLENTKIDVEIIRLLLKIVAVAYIIEFTSQSINDLGFNGLTDKLILCGRLIIFLMSIPILKATYDIILKLIMLIK